MQDRIGRSLLLYLRRLCESIYYLTNIWLFHRPFWPNKRRFGNFQARIIKAHDKTREYFKNRANSPRQKLTNFFADYKIFLSI